MIAQNEEGRIARALERLTWADEILVVDGGSQDRTVDTARKYGAKTLVHSWEGYSKQRSFALAHAANDWILMVDADELVTSELEQEVRMLMQGTPKANGYWILRRAFFLGREIKHSSWAPDTQLRLFDRRYAEVEEVPVHEGIRVRPPLDGLDSCLDHHTVESLSEYLARMNRYTTLEAEQRFGLKSRPKGLFKFISSPLGEFLKVYWVRGGFLESRRGLFISIYSAFYRFLIYAKLWHLQNSLSNTQAS